MWLTAPGSSSGAEVTPENGLPTKTISAAAEPEAGGADERDQPGRRGADRQDRQREARPGRHGVVRQRAQERLRDQVGRPAGDGREHDSATSCRQAGPEPDHERRWRPRRGCCRSSTAAGAELNTGPGDRRARAARRRRRERDRAGPVAAARAGSASSCCRRPSAPAPPPGWPRSPRTP